MHKAAAQRHYKTQREEQSKKRRGKHEIIAVTKKKRGRLSRVSWYIQLIVYVFVTSYNHQKLESRKDIFDCLNLPKERYEKWVEVLKLEYMSSEDSEEENTLVVRPIPWLSKKVEEFKAKLDEQRLG